MELYYIVISEGTDSKNFVSTIYRNSISISSDIGDAIAIKSLEDAKSLRRIVIDRTNKISDKVKIYKEVTTGEII